ncbi:MAG: ATP-dependent DNA ligase [Desulfobacteraceae bacterium 4572_19]|nr:MAG: ATP-dependent DNA ligase [Desulfobacteraceae bacterium 4572_19]
MKKFFHAVLIFLFFMVLAVPVTAHFGMLIPSDSMVMQNDSKTVTVDASFSHPFEGVGMELVKPKFLGIVANGEKINLNKSKQVGKTEIMNNPSWKINYKVKKPGVYIFYMEPEPYWEPAEDCFIIHYTKTYVTAFGDDENWDREIGLKTEIVPLSKPFGLYAGNVFQGIVKLNGKTVPFAEVEVEYYNEDGKAKAPTDYMVTQTIKADKNGVFTYAAPKAGWWGFAALNEADFKLKLKSGEEKDVELGAVIWVKFQKWGM